MEIIPAFYLTISTCVCLNSALGPQLSALPKEIHEGITPSLVVNCSFPIPKSKDGVNLMSLILYKKSDDSAVQLTEIASVTGDHVSVFNSTMTRIVTSTEGHIQRNQDSFLKVTWDNPTKADGGVYICEANVIDRLGHTIRITASFYVMRELSDLQKFVQSIVSLERLIQDSAKCCADQRRRIASLQWSAVRLSRALKHMEKSLALASSEQFKGRNISISNYVVDSLNTAQAVCETVDGYLAEIKNPGDVNFTESILNNVSSPLKGYVIGAKDDRSEGLWLWQHNYTKATSIPWSVGQPDNVNEEDCLEILGDHGAHLWNDVPCKGLDVLRRGFLCEIPTSTS